MSAPEKELQFLGLEPETLALLGYDPARRIVPAWFGMRASLPAVPEACPIRITARSQYKLFVNGVSVLFGPCRSARPIAYVDELDLSPYLRPGENRLAIQVFSYPEDPG